MRRSWVTSEAYAALIDVLRQARREGGVSQRELADRLEKPRSFVSKFESRERRLDVLEFIVVARAIGIGEAEMIERVTKAIGTNLDF